MLNPLVFGIWWDFLRRLICFYLVVGAVSSEKINEKHEYNVEDATFSSPNDSTWQAVGGNLQVSLDF